MGAEVVEVTITRQRLFNGHGARVPFSWLYDGRGSDGSRYDNRSIVELRSVLKRKYGRDGVRIIEAFDKSETLGRGSHGYG